MNITIPDADIPLIRAALAEQSQTLLDRYAMKSIAVDPRARQQARLQSEAVSRLLTSIA